MNYGWDEGGKRKAFGVFFLFLSGEFVLYFLGTFVLCCVVFCFVLFCFVLLRARQRWIEDTLTTQEIMTRDALTERKKRLINSMDDNKRYSLFLSSLPVKLVAHCHNSN